MHRVAVLSLVVLTAGFAPAPLPRAERRARADNLFEGLWSGGVVGSDGKLYSSEQQVQITSDRMIYYPDKQPFIYAMRLDRSARPAIYYIKGIDGNRSAGAEGRGIWRVEGDVMTMTYNPGANTPLPTTFEGQGKGRIVEVYRRVRR